jgi:predicted glycogen debranching enzyme
MDHMAHWWTHQQAVGDKPLAFLDREWLLTNGTGAFAMGTVPGINTRRYHALWIPATRPPVGRITAVNQMLEQLYLDAAAEPLEFNAAAFRRKEGEKASDALAPRGFDYLTRFERGTAVRWTYQTAGLTLTRELNLHYLQQGATLTYRLTGLGKRKAKLQLSPLMTLRDFHGCLRSANAGEILSTALDGTSPALRVQRDGHAVVLQASTGQAVADVQWWYDFHYPIEARRGLDDQEDNFIPGRFIIAAEGQDELQVSITMTLGDHPAEVTPAQRTGRIAHLEPIAGHLTDIGEAIGEEADALAQALAIAADDFIVGRTVKGEPLATIMAGYPWFADWGRDTFIALPGLLLCTGRYDEARSTLKAFAAAVQDGLVPNRFDDYDDAAAHYNTVDASLWFIQAAIKYMQVSGDTDAKQGWLTDAVKSIIDAYIKGTRYGIQMTGDCLISAGSPDSQLTWMDAACDGTVFTPRYGKAVEINALWFAALAGMAELLAEQDKPTAQHYEKLCARIGRSFPRVFWDQTAGYLYDHAIPDAEGKDVPDRTLRPNQILAASLPHSPLPRARAQKVIETISKHLLTPYGLRTLAETDPRYHPHYEGSPFQRDEAYHQGTVWPWLIGPYAEAVLRVGRFTDEAKREALLAVKPLIDDMLGPGMGQLHEIHEADPPHRPDGCPAQAWSVAEVIRVLKLIAKGG